MVSVPGAACTVDRLKRDEGPKGWPGQTAPNHNSRRQGQSGDTGRARSRFHRPSSEPRMGYTDFTYCRTWAGFVYVTFVIDCFSQAIVGWHASTVKDTAIVTTVLKMAL